MCKAMNRSIWNVVFGGFGADAGAKPAPGAGARRQGHRGHGRPGRRSCSSRATVVIVPGYGMAVAQAQHAVKEISTDD